MKFQISSKIVSKVADISHKSRVMVRAVAEASEAKQALEAENNLMTTAYAFFDGI